MKCLRNWKYPFIIVFLAISTKCGILSAPAVAMAATTEESSIHGTATATSSASSSYSNPTPPDTIMNEDNGSTGDTDSFPSFSKSSASSSLYHFNENPLSFAGRIFPILTRIAGVLQPYKAKEMWKAICTHAHPGDLAFLIFVGWGFIPSIRYPYEAVLSSRKTNLSAASKSNSNSNSNSNSPKTTSTSTSTSTLADNDDIHEGENDTSADKGTSPRSHHSPPTKAFQNTFTYFLCDHVARASRIGMAVYAIDCLAIALRSIGFDIKNYNKRITKTIYTCWIFSRLRNWKRQLIVRTLQNQNPYSSPEIRMLNNALLKSQSTHPSSQSSSTQYHPSSISDNNDNDWDAHNPITPQSSGPLGRAWLINHVANAVLYSAQTLALLDIINIHGGKTLGSVYAFGSMGTLMFTLASRDLASQLVGGLVLTTSDKLYPGEYVQFSNKGGDNNESGIVGTIVELGWMEAVIRTKEERLMVVPNTLLNNQAITNWSRIQTSRLHKKLHFQYENETRLKMICRTLREEIVASCPKAIVDGRRPFDVYCTDMDFSSSPSKNGGSNTVEVTVNVSFDLNPLEKEFKRYQQEFLFAIRRALDKCNVHAMDT